jgi:hypothetical protein
MGSELVTLLSQRGGDVRALSRRGGRQTLAGLSGWRSIWWIDSGWIGFGTTTSKQC